MKNQPINKGDVVVFFSTMAFCDSEEKEGLMELTTINNRKLNAPTTSIRLATLKDADYILNAKGWKVDGLISLKGTLRIDLCNTHYELQPRGTQWLNWTLEQAIAARKELDEAIDLLKIINPIAKKQWELNG